VWPLLLIVGRFGETPIPVSTLGRSRPKKLDGFKPFSFVNNAVLFRSESTIDVVAGVGDTGAGVSDAAHSEPAHKTGQ
jgi:hypothetical protein